MTSNKTTDNLPVNPNDAVDMPADLKDNQLFNKLLLIERCLWNSTGKSNAAQYIKKNVSHNGILISPSDAGFWLITNREDYVKISNNSPEWKYCAFKHIEFKRLSDDVVNICYKVEAYLNNNSPYKVLVSTTFQKNSNEQWQVIEMHHMMPYSPGVSKEAYDDELSKMK